MTTGELVLRPAGDADVGAIVQLLVLGAVPGGPPTAEDAGELGPYRAALRDIAEGGGAVLVAERGGQVVGVCQLIVFRHLQAHGGLCAEVESVHVHPDHRGQGIGRVLMGAAITRARDLGCYRVQLMSNHERTDAHRSYEALGFVASHQGFKLTLQ